MLAFLAHEEQDKIEISGHDNNTISVKSEISGTNAYSIYHNKWIGSMRNITVKYKLQINTSGSSIGIYVGVVSTDNEKYKCYHNDSVKNSYYLIQSDGTKYSYQSYDIDNNIKFKEKDEIIVILDLIKKELRISINNQKESVLFENITTAHDINYKLAVCMKGFPGDSISLIGVDLDDETEQKQDDTVNETIQTLQSKVVELTKKNQYLMQQNEELQSIIDDMDKQKSNETQNMMQETEALQNKIKRLESQLSILQEEQKELELENNKLKEENKELRIQNIDERKYKEWSNDEIVSWIMSKNDGQFNIYRDTLSKTLKEECVSGEDLAEVDQTDIKRWGVNKFKDMKSLHKCIVQLTSNINNNEGVNVAPTAYI